MISLAPGGTLTLPESVAVVAAVVPEPSGLILAGTELGFSMLALVVRNRAVGKERTTRGHESM